MTIELTGVSWGKYGSPAQGTRLNAMWTNDAGPEGKGAWVFIYGGRQWAAFEGGATAPWSAKAVTA